MTVLLMLISAVVFVMQIFGVDAWLLICLYWLVLTVKNARDAV